MTSETSHVQFVDDGARGRSMQGHITFPIVSMGIDHQVLHGSGGVVPRTTCRFAVIVFWNEDATAIWVEQNFPGIEAKAVRGVERTLDAIRVYVAGPNVRHESMPVVISTVLIRIEADHPGRTDAVFVVEEQQLHSESAAGVDAEVHASVRWCGSQGRTAAGRSSL